TLIETRSPVVGNLNGLPAGVRDEANRTQLDRDLALAEKDELTAEEEAVLANAEATQANLEEAEQFEDPLDGDPVVVQLYVYEPAAFEGDGRVAVAIGNVDTADHVAVNVPGFLAEVEGMDPQRAYNVYGEARFASRDSVAVIDWMGYNAPSPGGDDGVADASNVLDMGAAEAGATLLADDVAGIVAMRPDDDPHLTVIGNSYGSTTVAIAADERGLQADDVILTGSPGAGNADTAADFTTGTDHTWVASSSTDAVTYFGHSDGSIRWFGALGNDPAMDDFEAQRIQAENVDRENPVNPLNVPGQHGAYYDDDSESLFNVGLIVGGEYDRVLPADHRHQQPVLDLQNPVLPGDGPFWQFRLSWPLDVNAPWPTDPEAGREPELHSSNPDAVLEEDGDDEDEEVA
ncbi:MAG: alpha/beta hydrolase, partial [Acidimicrobiales bacterium]